MIYNLRWKNLNVANARGNVEDSWNSKLYAAAAKMQAIGSVNIEIYMKKSLQKKLIPLIREHNVSTYFWTDLASSHYGKKALDDTKTIT